MTAPKPTGIEVTHDPEIAVHLVQLHLCDLCLDGAGGQCHVPGCSLWLNRAPDIALRGNPGVTITDEDGGERGDDRHQGTRQR
jgi:hypothetical protein